jgi:hypothetical protein
MDFYKLFSKIDACVTQENNSLIDANSYCKKLIIDCIRI